LETCGWSTVSAGSAPPVNVLVLFTAWVRGYGCLRVAASLLPVSERRCHPKSVLFSPFSVKLVLRDSSLPPHADDASHHRVSQRPRPDLCFHLEYRRPDEATPPCPSLFLSPNQIMRWWRQTLARSVAVQRCGEIGVDDGGRRR
jgi:hypothetical protein